ncbi:unnamed protein product [Amoebophrya sp. A120]|nr:unnamed protein product [Amoebophrya sp. A120]|eukprot:GSA120T00022614001.1
MSTSSSSAPPDAESIRKQAQSLGRDRWQQDLAEAKQEMKQDPNWAAKMAAKKRNAAATTGKPASYKSAAERYLANHGDTVSKGSLVVTIERAERLGYSQKEMVLLFSADNGFLDISGWLDVKFEEKLQDIVGNYNPYAIDPYVCCAVGMQDPFTKNFQPNSLWNAKHIKNIVRKTKVLVNEGTNPRWEQRLLFHPNITRTDYGLGTSDWY